MECTFCRDNFTAHLQGELTGAQAARFDAHLRSCPECARDLADFRAAVGALRALPSVQPPANLLARIGLALDETPVPMPVRAAGWPRAWSWQHAGAFALAACLLITCVAVLRSGRLSKGVVREGRPSVVATVPAATAPTQETAAAPAQAPAAQLDAATPAAADALAPAQTPSPRAGASVARTRPGPVFGSRRSAPRPETTSPAPTPVHPMTAATTPAVGGAGEGLAPPVPTGPAAPFTTKGFSPGLEMAMGPAPMPAAATLAADTTPQPATRPGRSLDPMGVAPGDEIMRVDFVPPRTRQVGEIGVAALVMEPSRLIRRAEVRVRSDSGVEITNAAADGLIFRGELPANRRTTVAVRMDPREPGAHDMRIELKTEIPGASTALDVHVAGFKPAVPAPAPQTGKSRQGVNLVLNQTEIRSALRQVGQDAGVRVDMDAGVGGQHVNYSFHDVPAEAALRVLADEGGYRVAPDDGGWKVTKP